jgi:hypothetical protein
MQRRTRLWQDRQAGHHRVNGPVFEERGRKNEEESKTSDGLKQRGLPFLAFQPNECVFLALRTRFSLADARFFEREKK